MLEKIVNHTMLLVILGALLILGIISYSIGYHYGSELGQDITRQVIEAGRLTN
jgi:hypothetical protein